MSLCSQGGPFYTTIMALGPRNRRKDGLLGPTSITVVHVGPLGLLWLQCLGALIISAGSIGFRALGAYSTIASIRSPSKYH